MVTKIMYLRGNTGGMYEWVFIVVLLVAAYAAVAFYIHRRNLYPERFVFYGPVLAVRTQRVAFLDRFTVISAALRVYSTIGVAMVILISVGMVVLLFFSLQMTLIVQPEPTGIYAPQNLLLIRGSMTTSRPVSRCGSPWSWRSRSTSSGMASSPG